jgi:hypothetical protein
MIPAQSHNNNYFLAWAVTSLLLFVEDRKFAAIAETSSATT